MEVIEAIVIQNSDAEGKESAASSSVESDKTKAEFIWTLQATWHLVNTRLEMDQAFDQPVCKKKKLWEVVAEKVNAKLRESGVTVKAYECDLKWRNMLATYRKNTDRARRLGVASVHWEFFKAMHEVLGKSREEIEAQRQAKLSGTRVGKAIASKRFTPILPTPPATAAACISRPPQDILQLYMELQERKLNMWAQQKALEERKIEAINNLAQAISSLAHVNSPQTSKDGH
ncbi:trihelix transcription factor GT-1 [Fundulus heteroclitus]|nr:trihelix transcription factor GT-1 [Fundulus heteroclitus]